MKQRAIRRARMRHNITMGRSALVALVAAEVSRQASSKARATLAALRRSLSVAGACA